MSFDRYKADIDRLIRRGNELTLAMIFDVSPELKKKADKEELKKLPRFQDAYQSWYSEALACISQLMPARVDDFVSYYKPIKTRKDLNAENYTISDYLRGLSASRGFAEVVGQNAAVNPLEQQVRMVEALKQRFESSLFDIRALVQADLFDNELDAADEINRKGFQRGAGAIAGVVLEGHLATVCTNHKIAVAKNPTISRLNDALKAADVIDQATWRFIQHLGDLRNLCDHKRGADPTTEQMQELIAGTRKIMKTIF